MMSVACILVAGKLQEVCGNTTGCMMLVARLKHRSVELSCHRTAMHGQLSFDHWPKEHRPCCMPRPQPSSYHDLNKDSTAVLLTSAPRHAALQPRTRLVQQLVHVGANSFEVGLATVLMAPH